MASNLGPYDKPYKLGLAIGDFVREPANAEFAQEAKDLGAKHNIWNDPSEHTFDEIWRLEKNVMPSFGRTLLIAEGFVCLAAGLTYAILIPNVPADEMGDSAKPLMWTFTGAGAALTTGGFLIRSSQRKKLQEKYAL